MNDICIDQIPRLVGLEGNDGVVEYFEVRVAYAVNGRIYLALASADVDSDDEEEVIIVGYEPTEDGYDLRPIESEDEWENALTALYSVVPKVWPDLEELFIEGIGEVDPFACRPH